MIDVKQGRWTPASCLLPFPRASSSGFCPDAFISVFWLMNMQGPAFGRRRILIGLGVLCVAVLLAKTIFQVNISVSVTWNDHWQEDLNLPTMHASAAKEGHRSKRKNLVFILIDDLGIRDLACYRPEEKDSFHLTPNIDKLAASGVLFQNAYGAAPTCSLSRAAIFTGISPSRLGMFHRSLSRHNYTEERKCFQKFNARTLPLHTCTTPLGTAFQQAGWQTGFVGKWHNYGSPTDCGFTDASIGSNGQANLNTQFSPYECDTARNPNYCKPRSVPPPVFDIEVPDGTFSADHLTLEAVQTLRNFTKHDNPFLLVLSHYAVHYPIESKDEYELEFEQRRQAMSLKTYEGKYEKNIYTRTLQSNPTYAGMLKSVDDSVGTIMEELKSLKIENDTYVIFTSDNGGLASHHLHKLYPPTSNMPYDLGKTYLGEGGIRVPLIIAGPEIPQAQTREYKSIGTDLYPTMLDLAGIELRPADHIDGQSLVGPLKSNDLTRADPIFWQADFEYFWGNKKEYPSAILWEDWKLIERYPPNNVGGAPEIFLYNIHDDPSESSDLSITNACEARRLYERLKLWQSEWFHTGYFDRASQHYPNCKATPFTTHRPAQHQNTSVCPRM